MERSEANQGMRRRAFERHGLRNWNKYIICLSYCACGFKIMTPASYAQHAKSLISACSMSQHCFANAAIPLTASLCISGTACLNTIAALCTMPTFTCPTALTPACTSFRT